MQDKHFDTIIKLIDGELDDSSAKLAEEQIASDDEMRESYALMLLSKQAMQSNSLQQRVQQIQKEFLAEDVAPQKETAKVVKFSYAKRITSIAAVLVGIAIGYTIFLYATTSNDAVYKSGFVSYELPVSRGEATTNNIDSLYNTKNYTAVVNAVNNSTNKNQQSYFLAAQSYLQLNDAESAITDFKEVENLNANSSSKYFVEETDYYLALAYIKAGKIDLAKSQLNKILSNKQHMFYSNADAISKAKISILQMKDKN